MSELIVELPRYIEDLTLPDPSLVNYYRALDQRAIWIDDEIDVPTLEIEKNILIFNKKDEGEPIEERKPIKLMFFTPGGDLDVNNSLIDVIMLSKTPVYGINMGMAYSSGTFVFLACHKRYAMPRSTFLLHQGSAGMSGTHDQITQVTAEYKRKINELIDFIESRTTIPRKTLVREIKKEWFLTAKQALEFGICDEIVDSIDILL